MNKIKVKITGNPHLAGEGNKFTRFGNSPTGIWGIYMATRGIDTETQRKCTIYWDKKDSAIVHTVHKQNGFAFESFELSSETIGNPTIVFDDGTVLDANEVDIIRK